MKPLDEQDHYELLEIGRNASPEQVDRAYRVACSTYTEESMAGMSVFEVGDVDVIRARLEEAHAVLMDETARAAYDAELEKDGIFTEQVVTPAAPESVPATLEDLDEGGGDFDGARLRRMRLHRGVEIEDIASTTKINPTYLHFLEEERFEELPAAVYVRGFVMGYANAVGLDPRLVAESYMARYAERRGNPRRRLFGRN